MKNLLLSIFVLSLSLTSVLADDMTGVTYSFTRPVDVDVDFDASYFETKPWINEFRYVVVVNKANKGKDVQSINIYENGLKIISGKVSTGRDQFEAAGEHHSKKDSWSVTPTGYYTPSYLDKNHRSSAYGGRFSWLIGGTKMPYAIFFNGGIALHQAPKGTESALGTKASGGCVRLPGVIAADLFARVLETQGSKIPKFTVEGNPEVDDKGNIEYKDSGFSTLIIVKNKIVE